MKKKGREWIGTVKDVGEHAPPDNPDWMIALRYVRDCACDYLGNPAAGWQIERQAKGRSTVYYVFHMLPYALERLGGMLDMAPVHPAYRETTLSLMFPSQEGVQIWLARFSNGRIWRGYTLDPVEAERRFALYPFPQATKKKRQFRVRYD